MTGLPKMNAFAKADSEPDFATNRSFDSLYESGLEAIPVGIPSGQNVHALLFQTAVRKITRRYRKGVKFEFVGMALGRFWVEPYRLDEVKKSIEVAKDITIVQVY